MLNKTYVLSHMKSGCKNPKKYFLLHFDIIVRVWVLLFDSSFSIFQRFSGLDWSIAEMKELVSLKLVVMKKEKNTFSVTIAAITKRKNASLKKQSYTYVLPLKNGVDWIRTRGGKKCHNFNKVYFEKKGSNVEIHVIFIFRDYLQQFCF